MSPLWVLPVCVLAAGAVWLALAARRLAAATAALRPELAALDQLAAEARAARLDIDAARRRGAALAEVPGRLRAVRAAQREARLGGTDR